MSTHKSLIFKFAVVFAAVFITQLLIGIIALYQVLIHQAQSYVEHATKRIQDDITFQNNKWNLSRYNADSEVPGTYPVYILGSDGYVIDRWKPINGFLDTSDSKHLLTYTTPQTISTSTQQLWRIYSKPIQQNHQTLGVITVAIYNPSQENISEIDQRLKDTASYLLSNLSVKNDKIDVSKIDIRNISYDISFQVVDRYNKIISKNNNTNSIDRIPNFIDLSYIGDLLSKPTFQEISDMQTGERFMFLTSPIIHNNQVLGVTVVGRSISSISELLWNFLIVEIVVGLLICSGGIYAAYFVSRAYLKNTGILNTREAEHIHFNKQSGILSVDDTEITIPYATNQYYLCEALFSAPKKRWEKDVLLERFGEVDISHSRKIYDAMVLINRKVYPVLGTKLFITREKAFQMNPALISKIV